MDRVRGADFACYHQAREAGFTATFRAFLSSQVQDLNKTVHLRGDVILHFWREFFGPTAVSLPDNVPIYSFDRRDIMNDPNW